MISTEDKIIRAATTVFARRGVSGATTREIAQRARVNEVTLFRHFKNKDELLRQVVMHTSRHFEGVFAEASLEDAEDLRRTVQNYADAYVRKLVEHEELVRTFIGELHRNLELGRSLFVRAGRMSRQRLICYLRAAKRKGLARKDIDPIRAADALTGMLLGGVLRRPLVGDEYDLASYVKTSVKLFLKGLQP